MNYPELTCQIAALIRGVPHTVSNFANTAAAIYQALDRVNWAGFYLLEGGTLILGPFQGKPACIEIPLGKGVCGTAAREQRTLLVPNVHTFPGHIACDSASNSEIVIPIFRNGQVFGVLDIDSPEFSRFDEEDQAGLEAIVRLLEQSLRHPLSS